MKGLLWLFKKYNYVLVFIVLETIAMLLLSKHNAFQHSILANFHREIAGMIYERTEGVGEYLNLRKNNEVLVRENTILRNKIAALSSTRSDPGNYNSYNSQYFYTPAHIVNSSHFKQFNYLTIDKGKKQGLSSDMGVISDEGIVGIILESSSNYSTIIPIINRDFHLSAKIKNSNFAGILQWEGENPYEADLNEIPYHAKISMGDTIVTSGFSTVFPEGLFVGTIKEFTIKEGNFYRIKVDLGTQYQRLFNVYVINNFNQKEQRTLESIYNQ